MPIITTLLTVSAAAIGALAAGSCFFTTPEGTVRPVYSLGRFSSHRGAGLGLKLPYPLQVAGTPFSLEMRQVEVKVECRTRDGAYLSLPIVVSYRPSESGIGAALTKLPKPEKQIATWITGHVQGFAHARSFEDLWRTRGELPAELLSTFKPKLHAAGYSFEGAQVLDPVPAIDVQNAHNRLVAARRIKEAATLEGEAEHIAADKRGEAEKVGAKAKAEAQSETRKIVAEGASGSIKKLRDDLGISTKDAAALYLDIMEKDALRHAAQHGRVTYVAHAPDRETYGAIEPEKPLSC